MESEKLKKAMGEIKKILDKHDIAGLVVIHEPGYSEYLLKLDPGYSCCKIVDNKVRIRAKAEDFGGDKDARDKKLSDTANMLHLITHTAGSAIYPFFQVSEDLDKKLNAEHISLNRKADPDLPF